MHGKQLVAVNATEHPSVLAAFERLRAMGHEVRVLPVDSEGALDYEALQKALDDGASLVAACRSTTKPARFWTCSA